MQWLRRINRIAAGSGRWSADVLDRCRRLPIHRGAFVGNRHGIFGGGAARWPSRAPSAEEGFEAEVLAAVTDLRALREQVDNRVYRLDYVLRNPPPAKPMKLWSDRDVQTSLITSGLGAGQKFWQEFTHLSHPTRGWIQWALGSVIRRGLPLKASVGFRRLLNLTSRVGQSVVVLPLADDWHLTLLIDRPRWLAIALTVSQQEVPREYPRDPFPFYRALGFERTDDEQEFLCELHSVMITAIDAELFCVLRSELDPVLLRVYPRENQFAGFENYPDNWWVCCGDTPSALGFLRDTVRRDISPAQWMQIFDHAPQSLPGRQQVEFPFAFLTDAEPPTDERSLNPICEADDEIPDNNTELWVP